MTPYLGWIFKCFRNSSKIWTGTLAEIHKECFRASCCNHEAWPSRIHKECIFQQYLLNRFLKFFSSKIFNPKKESFTPDRWIGSFFFALQMARFFLLFLRLGFDFGLLRKVLASHIHTDQRTKHTTANNGAIVERPRRANEPTAMKRRSDLRSFN